MLLINERFLDVNDTIASSVPKEEVLKQLEEWDFPEIGNEDSQSVRQSVVEQSRFYSIKLNTAW